MNFGTWSCCNYSVGKTVVCKCVVCKCPVSICGIVILTNLVVFSMISYDAIHGMDWLAKHLAIIDCVGSKLCLGHGKKEK